MDVARQPYALTLLEWGLLVETKQVEQMARAGERIDSASLAAMAHHKPDELRKVDIAHKQRVGVHVKTGDIKKRAMAMHDDLVKRGFI